MDTIIGLNHQGAILTINGMASGFLWMKKLVHRTSDAVYLAALDLLMEAMGFLHTITSDNGKEFADGCKIARGLLVHFYLAKPYHSWERGANENLEWAGKTVYPQKIRPHNH